MHLSTNTYTPNFKAVMISPNGYKALERWNKGRLSVNINEFQKQRQSDKYVDAVISGIPDEYGHYTPIMYLKDKVIAETYRDMFKLKSAEGDRFFKINTTDGRFRITAKNGQKLPDEVAEIMVSGDRARYLSFEDDDSATKFRKCAQSSYIGGMCLGIVEALELYYRYSIEKNQKDSLKFKCKKDNYVDFMLNLQNVYGKKPVHEIIPEIMKSENLLGKGREKDVYKIDKMPGYALCVMRNEYTPDRSISPFYQHFQGSGPAADEEPIVISDSGMYIKKYTKGISHSLQNRAMKNKDIEPLTYDDVAYFISQLKTLSSFPAKSFVDFAKQLQVLNERRIRVDFNNPNNILVDSDLEKITIIDLISEDNDVPEDMIRPINGLSDMESALCDSIMYFKLYDIATDEDKIKMDEYAKTIIKKCGIASKVANLGNLPRNTRVYFDNIDQNQPIKNGKTRLQKYEDFRNHFKGIVSDDIVSTQYQAKPLS